MEKIKKYLRGDLILSGDSIDDSLASQQDVLEGGDDPFKKYRALNVNLDQPEQPAQVDTTTSVADPFAEARKKYGVQDVPDPVDPVDPIKPDDPLTVEAVEREKDLLALERAVQLPPGIDKSKIKIEKVGGTTGLTPSYGGMTRGMSNAEILAQQGKAPSVSKLKQATLPNGETYLFAPDGETTAQDKAYDVVTNVAAKALIKGASLMLDLVSNSAKGLIPGGAQLYEDFMPATTDAQKEVSGFWYTPLANKAEEFLKKYAINVAPDQEYQDMTQHLAEKEAKGESVITDPIFWKRVFTDETFHNEVTPAMETVGEFLIPATGVAKLALGTRFLKAAQLTGALTKAEKASKLIKFTGSGLDLFTGAYMSGSLEAHMEGENNGEAIAVDLYNSKLQPGQEDLRIRNLSELANSPDSPLKEEALIAYQKAYNDMFSSNQAALTVMNMIPLGTLMNTEFKLSKIPGRIGKFMKANPRLGAAAAIGSNIVEEASQEGLQWGIEDYERNKILHGISAYEDTTWGDLKGATVDVLNNFDNNVNASMSILLGGVLGGGTVATSELTSMYDQLHANKKIKELLKDYPVSDFASIQGLVNNGKIDINTLAEKINGLNSYFVNKDFLEKAKTLNDPDLIDYAWQQSVSSLIYDARKEGVDEETAKDTIESLLTKHVFTDKTAVDSDGTTKSSTEVLSRRMNLIQDLFDAYTITDKLANKHDLPEKLKQNVFSAVIGRDTFNKLAGNLYDKLSAIQGDITSKELQVATRRTLEQNQVEGDDAIATAILEGANTSRIEDSIADLDAIEDLKKEKQDLFKKYQQAIAVSNSYAKSLKSLVNDKKVRQYSIKTGERKIKESVRAILNAKTYSHLSREEKKNRIATDVFGQNPQLDPEDILTETEKELSAEEQLNLINLKQTFPALATQESASIESLINPPGKPISDIERLTRKKLVDSVIKNQFNAAEKSDPKDRYVGRPILFEVEANEFYSKLTPEGHNELDRRFAQHVGGSEEAVKSFQTFLRAPIQEKLKDPNFRTVLKSMMLESPTMAETNGELDQRHGIIKAISEEVADAIEVQVKKDNEVRKWLEEDIYGNKTEPDTKDDLKDDVEDSEIQKRNEDGVIVLHRVKVNEEEAKLAYTVTADQHAQGIAYLHLGLMTPGDKVHLEVEPGIAANAKEDINWWNLTIQAVIYANGQRVVVGALKNNTTNTTTNHLVEVRKDIYNQWKNNKSTLIKTNWQTTVKEIFKGHIEKVPYQRGEAEKLPLTGEIIEGSKIPQSSFEIGMAAGTQKNRRYVYTNGAKFTVNAKRNTESSATKTGFMYLLIKSHKAFDKGQYHWETVGLYTRRVKDIQADGKFKSYRDIIIENINKNDVTAVQYLVNFNEENADGTYSSGIKWEFNSSPESITVGATQKVVPANAPYLIREDQVYVGGESIYNQLRLGDRPVNIIEEWFNLSSLETINHPVYGEISLRNLVLNHITKSDIDLDKLNLYDFNGHTAESLFHSGKFTVNNWSKEIEIEDVVPSEPVEKPKRKSRPIGDFKISDFTNPVWENNTKSRTWFKARLEEIGYNVNDAELEKLHNLLRLSSTSKVWGVARDAAIILASQRPEGTTRHEAFHIVFNLFLTDKQRELAYAEASKRFKDDLHKAYDSLSHKDKLEEFMANEFEHYKQTRLFSEGFEERFPNIAKFLQGLYDFIFAGYDIVKQYISKDRSLTDLYRQIDNNSFGRNFLGQRRKSYTELLNQNVSERIRENSPGDKFKITDLEPALIAPAISLINKDALNAVISTDEKYRNKITGRPKSLHEILHENVKNPGVEPFRRLFGLYTKAKEYLQEHYITPWQEDLDAIKEDDPVNYASDPDYIKIKGAVDRVTAAMNLIAPDVLTTDKYGAGDQEYDFTQRLLYDLRHSQGVIYNKGKISSTEDIEYDEETYDNTETTDETGQGEFTQDEEDSNESWQRDSFSENSYAKVSPRLKQEISTVPVVENGKTKYTPMGGVEYYNPAKIFNILVDKISSCASLEEMREKIVNLRQIDPRIDSIFAKMEAYEQARYNQLEKDLYKAIGNKYVVTYLMNLSNQKGIRIFYSNRKGVTKKIVQQFVIDFTHLNWDLDNNKPKEIIGGPQGITVEKFEEMLKEINPVKRNENLPILLTHLGFDVTPIAKKFLAGNTSGNNDITYAHVEYILNQFKDGINSALYTNVDGRGGAIEKITAIADELKDADQSIDLKTFTDGKNKLVSGHTSVGLIVKKLYKLRKLSDKTLSPSAYQELLTDLKEDNNYHFYRDAPILKWLGLDGKFKNIGLDLAFFDSRKRNDAEEGSGITDMAASEQHINHIEMFIGGILSKKKKKKFAYSWSLRQFNTTWYNIAVPDSPKTYYVKLPLFETMDDLLNQYLDVWEQEKRRIDALNLSFKEAEEKGETYTTGNPVFDVNGRRFHFFPGMNSTRLLSEPLTSENEFSLRSEALEQIKKELNKYYSDYLSKLSSLGVIEVKDGKIAPSSAMSDNTLPGKTFSETLQLFFLNDNLMTTQMITLMSGDPAFYKGKKSVAGDYQKRNKAMHANGIYGAFKRKTYSVVYLKDIKLESEPNFVNQVEKWMSNAGFKGKALENIVNAYKFNGKDHPHNTTDAQGYITLSRWKEILEAFGDWTPRHDEVYENLQNGVASTEDLFLVAQPLKPHYFGFKEREGFKFPLYHKYSAVVLHPLLVKDNKVLENIYNKMMDPALNIDEVIFESGVKVGNFNEVTLEDFIGANSLDLVSKVDVVKNEFYKEQQKVPEHFRGQVKNLLGIQFRKLVSANMSLGRTYSTRKELIEFIKLIDKNLPDTKTELTGEDLLMILDKLQAKNISSDLKRLIDRISSKEVLRDILLDAIMDKELGSNYSTGVELDANGDFKLPLWFPTISRKMEEVFTSLFKKVSKQKHNGGSYVNMSSIGFDSQLKVRVDDTTGEFYVEIALPLNTNLLGKNLDTGEIEKIQEGVVYRIPTEEKYSMFPVRVVKWLDPAVGGIIAMPREVTTIAGLDFDIDKVYSLLYNYEVKDGKVEISRDSNTREGRENLMLDSYLDILSNGYTFKDWARVQSVQPLKDLRTSLGKETESVIPISTRQEQTTYVSRNLAGKNLIGIFANNNSFHALAMYSNIKLTDTAYSKILIGSLSKYSDKNNKSKLSTSLTKQFSYDGELVSRNFAMLLSAAVDNAKDPILDDLNINVFTAPMLTLLLHMGVDMDAAIRRINEPDIINATDLFFNKSLAEATTNPNVKALYDTGRALGKIVSALRIDSGTGPTLHDVDKKINDIQNIDSKVIDIGDRLLPKIYKINNKYVIDKLNVPDTIYRYIDVIVQTANEGSKNFPYFENEFLKVKEILSKFQTKSSPMRSNERRLADLEHLAVLHYSLFETTSRVLEDPINFGKNFPTYFYSKTRSEYLSDKSTKTKKYNNLLREFSIDTETGKLILFDKNSIDKNRQQDLQEQWASGLQDSQNPDIKVLFEELLAYGFLINGYQFTRDSFMHLAPTDFFSDNAGFKSYKNTSNLALEHVAAHIALNNANKFAPKFKNERFSHLNTKDLEKLVVGTDGDNTFYAPMYSKRVQDAAGSYNWVIFLNKEYYDSNFMQYENLTDPTYIISTWKDPGTKGRAISLGLDSLIHLGNVIEETKSVEPVDNQTPDQDLDTNPDNLPRELTDEELDSKIDGDELDDSDIDTPTNC